MQSKMIKSISTEHLINCIIGKQKYQETKIYIQGAKSQNEKIYQMINDAIYKIIKDNKKQFSEISKLYCLKFFKDVLISAQFHLIDAMNPKIEDKILEVALYNSKLKDKNRGSQYFIEVEKRKKGKEMEKIGANFVQYATQILWIMALWYPQNQEEQPSRFTKYQQQLKNKGIQYPNQKSLIFFNKIDKQNFKNNYKIWIENQQNIKSSSNVEETKQMNKKQQQIQQKKQSIQVTQTKQKIEQKQVLKRQKSLEKPNIQKVEDKQLKSETRNKYKKQVNCQKNNEQKNVQKIQDRQDNINDKKQSQFNKQNKQVDQINRIDNKRQFNLKEIKQKKQKIKKQQQIQIQKQKYYQFEQQLKYQRIKVQVLAEQNTTIIKQLTNVKQKMNEFSDQVSENQKKWKQVENQLFLKLKQKDQQFQSLKSNQKVLKELNNTLQKQNIKIKSQINQLSLQLKHKVQNRQDQNIKQLKNQKQQNKNYHKNIEQNHNYQSYSMSDYLQLKKQLKIKQNNINHNLVWQNQYQSRNQFLCMNKTQTPLNKFKQPLYLQKNIKKNNKFKTINSYNYTENKFLEKKYFTKTFYQDRNRKKQYKKKMISVIPYIPEYFNIKELNTFILKNACLCIHQKSYVTFFKTNQLQMSILKNYHKNKNISYILIIKNCTFINQNIKIISQQNQFMIQGQKQYFLLPKQIAKYSINAERIINLNFRIPKFSLIINCQKSLESTIIPEFTFKEFFCLPITLLDYCNFDNDQNYFINNINEGYQGFKCEKFKLNGQFKNIYDSLKFLLFKQENGCNKWLGIIKFYHIQQQIKILCKIKQKNRFIDIFINTINNNQLAIKFTKVILQILIFLLS